MVIANLISHIGLERSSPLSTVTVKGAAGSNGHTCPSLGVLPCVWTTNTAEIRKVENSANAIARGASTEKVL